MSSDLSVLSSFWSNLLRTGFQWLSTHGNLLLAMGSFIISILIYKVYRRQNDILRAQNKASVAAYQPLVGVHNQKQISDGEKYDVCPPDRLLLTISNLGNSLARNMRISWEIAYNPEDHELRIKSREVPIQRLSSEMWWRDEFGVSLAENSERIDFYSTPTLTKIESQNESMIRFDKAMEELHNQGVQKVLIGTSLKYSDAIGRDYEIELRVYEAKLHLMSRRGFDFHRTSISSKDVNYLKDIQ